MRRSMLVPWPSPDERPLAGARSLVRVSVLPGLRAIQACRVVAMKGQSFRLSTWWTIEGNTVRRLCYRRQGRVVPAHEGVRRRDVDLVPFERSQPGFNLALKVKPEHKVSEMGVPEDGAREGFQRVERSVRLICVQERVMHRLLRGPRIHEEKMANA